MRLKLLFFSLLASLAVFGQVKITAIDSINANKFKYAEEEVRIRGFVTGFAYDDSETLSRYYLKGKFREEIEVHTRLDEEPDQTHEYEIEGTVYIRTSGEIFIRESSRTCLDCAPPPQGCQCKDGTISIACCESAQSEVNWTLVLLGGAAILLILVLVVVFSRGSENKNTGSAPSMSGSGSTPSPTMSTVPTTRTSVAADSPEDFKTVKISTVQDPKTMKFIPGKLDIVGGADSGKSFRIAGFPSGAKGNVVTIGRANVKGPKEYAHIKLEDKTVSREQAEMREKDGKLYIKNLSDVNRTQVDGVALGLGEEVEITAGQTIRMGELELMYAKG
jgi:hypothetical protein